MNKHDQAMYAKGYLYKLVARDNTIEPLYCKQLMQIGPVMRDYPNLHFEVIDLRKLGKSEVGA